MSAFAETDFDAESYDRSRPSYPREFYALLDDYHRGPRHCAVDVGCGPGTATFQMAAWLKSFDHFIGTDISATMIEKAASSSNGQDKRLSFRVSSSVDFSFLGDKLAEKQCIDMVTAVECVHWFDFVAFQSSVAANLRSGGTFAIWGYADAVFLDYPDLDAMLDNLAYGDDALGPLWEQPGRHILQGLLKDWVFDKRYFADELEVQLHAAQLRSKQLSDYKHKPLLIVKEMKVSEFANYVKTWSAYHVWKGKHGKTEPDVVDETVKKITTMHPELTLDSEVKVAWNTFYKFARRI